MRAGASSEQRSITVSHDAGRRNKLSARLRRCISAARPGCGTAGAITPNETMSINDWNAIRIHANLRSWRDGLRSWRDGLRDRRDRLRDRRCGREWRCAVSDLTASRYQSCHANGSWLCLRIEGSCGTGAAGRSGSMAAPNSAMPSRIMWRCVCKESLPVSTMCETSFNERSSPCSYLLPSPSHCPLIGEHSRGHTWQR
jgi:hypothetical protein